MRAYTQGRCLSNVMFLTKGLIVEVTYKHVREYTQERSLSNVMSVIKHFIAQVTYKHIREYTQERRRRSDRIFVIKCLIHVVHVPYKTTR